METKTRILTLYRNILKTGSSFKDYNFRSYILRRTKEVFIILAKYIFFFNKKKEFHKYKLENNQEKHEAFIKEGISQLEMLKRQVVIQNSFFVNNSVIENQ